jgi:hypothetical protein
MSAAFKGSEQRFVGYRRLRRSALRHARRWFPTLPQADIEDLYQAASLSVLRTPGEVMSSVIYWRPSARRA